MHEGPQLSVVLFHGRFELSTVICLEVEHKETEEEKKKKEAKTSKKKERMNYLR